MVAQLYRVREPKLYVRAIINVCSSITGRKESYKLTEVREQDKKKEKKKDVGADESTSTCKEDNKLENVADGKQ